MDYYIYFLFLSVRLGAECGECLDPLHLILARETLSAASFLPAAEVAASTLARFSSLLVCHRRSLLS